MSACNWLPAPVGDGSGVQHGTGTYAHLLSRGVADRSSAVYDVVWGWVCVGVVSFVKDGELAALVTRAATRTCTPADTRLIVNATVWLRQLSISTVNTCTRSDLEHTQRNNGYTNLPNAPRRRGLELAIVYTTMSLDGDSRHLRDGRGHDVPTARG